MTVSKRIFLSVAAGTVLLLLIASPTARGEPPVAHTASTASAPQTAFSMRPTADEISAAHVFPAALVPMGAPPSAEEKLALSRALGTYQRARLATGPSDAVYVDPEPIKAFLSAFPQSSWRVSLLTYLGDAYYAQGAFTTALVSWQQAWDLGRTMVTNNAAATAAVDEALAQLAAMNSRLGRVDELQRLFAQAAGRELHGPTREKYVNAQEALWEMQHNPGQSFKCGPWALDSISSLTNPGVYRQMIHDTLSTDHGTSLSAVADLARKMKLDLRPVHRETASVVVPVPAVVHWKLGHYGALLKREGDRYLLQDPTFNTQQWVRQSVLDAESSGYFLIASTNVTKDWRAVDAPEAGTIWGKGVPGGHKGGSCKPGDAKSGGGKPKKGHKKGKDKPQKPHKCPPPNGMASWNVHLMVNSLNISDTPLAYTPPVGPAISFDLNYDQREDNQPSSLTFSNLGFQWNFAYIETLTVDSANAYIDRGAGGYETFTDFASTAQVSASGLQSDSYVTRVSGGFQEVYADGSYDVFGLADGSGRYYMTQIVDEHGNAVKLGYDNQYRLATITDAIGQVSTLTYGLASDALKITKITDPFGRTASFVYDSNNRLIKITDAVGMTSQFTYDTGTFVTSLVTGYGTTTFSYLENGFDRTLNITNPDGSKEMAQSLGGPVPGIADSESVVPTGISTENEFLSDRDAFYWDRKAMAEAPGNVTKATLYHFAHYGALEGPLLESTKQPYENRVWYFNQGQTSPFYTNDGETDNPTQIARVLDDGSTQRYQYSYNSLSNLTQEVDPAGRTTTYAYAANGIDLISATQTTQGGASSDVGVQATYNNQHLPLTITDAAGQTTTFTYNTAGQVLTVVDAKNEKTTNTYNASGYLTAISGPFAPSGQMTYAYDTVGRVYTVTDALGYVLTYTYDNLDRVTAITYPDGTQDKITYTLLDITQSTDRLNRLTNYAFNSLDQLTKITDPLGQATSFTYCNCGSLSSIVDALGHTTKFSYDVEGRRTSKTYPDGSQATYQFEGTTNRLRSEIDARGQTTVYHYNIDNSTDYLSFPNATITTATISLTYDSDYPRVASIRDGTGTTTFSYYPVTKSPATLGAASLSAVTSPLGTVSYGYDALGRVASRTVDGVAETITFDALNRVSTIGNPLGTFTYTYNGNSEQLTGLAYPNGQSTVLTYFPTSQDERLQVMKNLAPNGTSILSQWTYAYNAAGEVTSWTQQRGTAAARVWTAGYDSTDQLLSVGLTNPTATYAYTYDKVSNRLTENANGTTTAAAYNTLNELANAMPPPEADRTYEWDARMQLTAINYPATSARTEFTYDGLGHRVRIVEKTNGSVTSTKQFLWDGQRLCEERDATGTVTKRFFPQGVQLFGGTTAGLYYYTFDHLGNIREMTDSTGAIRAQYDYDPFGRRTLLNGDLATDFGFTGQYLHAPSGLSLALLRAYDPNLGRWISRDPTEGAELLPEGPNMYAYAANNPFNTIDPTGGDNIYSAFILGLIKHFAKEYALPADNQGTQSLANSNQRQIDRLYDKLRLLQKLYGNCPNAAQQKALDDVFNQIRPLEITQGRLKAILQALNFVADPSSAVDYGKALQIAVNLTNQQ